MKQLRDKNGLTLDEFLAKYDPDKYRHPSVTVDMAVFTMLRTEGECDLAVLLIRRGNHPYLGTWALPGGFVEMEEELADAAARELQEETGVTGVPLRPFGMFGGVNRDPRTRVISAGFFAVAPMCSLAPGAGDDAADASLFVVETSLEAASASAETYRMTLFGRRILCARAQLRYDALGAQAAQVPGEMAGDLASDHGLVLFSALRALAVLPRERVARLLTRDCPDLFDDAVEALDRALGAIPTEDEEV